MNYIDKVLCRYGMKNCKYETPLQIKKISSGLNNVPKIDLDKNIMKRTRIKKTRKFYAHVFEVGTV